VLEQLDSETAYREGIAPIMQGLAYSFITEERLETPCPKLELFNQLRPIFA
jgi:hypothetical protein